MRNRQEQTYSLLVEVAHLDQPFLHFLSLTPGRSFASFAINCSLSICCSKIHNILRPNQIYFSSGFDHQITVQSASKYIINSQWFGPSKTLNTSCPKPLFFSLITANLLRQIHCITTLTVVATHSNFSYQITI